MSAAADDRSLVVGTVEQILAKDLSADPEALWSALADAGMTGVGLDEEVGGSGGGFADAVAVTATLAAGAAALPAAEHLLVAGPALAALGGDLPDLTRPLTAAVADAGAVVGVQGDRRLRGVVDLPWLGMAYRAVVVAPREDGRGGLLALVDVEGRRADRDNLAGEPRGLLELDGADATVARIDAEGVDAVRAHLALARAVQMSAALERVLDWTVEYVGQREQFGRALGGFQTVQADLARMAGEVTATAALTDAAVLAVAAGQDPTPLAAAARIRAGAAVEVVARRAHQLHGAIGFTQEHRLHHLTRRLWAWRDEAASERSWARRLGRDLTRGPDLWTALTRLT